MQKVTLDEIVGLERYEKIRDDFCRRIIELKKHRRVSVGDRVTFVFENQETVRFQIQEMLRVEHITDIDKVRFEVTVYNERIPEDGELSATMLIEITEQAQIRLKSTPEAYAHRSGEWPREKTWNRQAVNGQHNNSR